MAAPVPLRSDFTATELRRLARQVGDAGQVRRLLALAAIYAGEPRSAAAAIGGVGLQTVRDWVLRFNAKGPEGVATGKPPGNRPLLNGQQRAALAQIVEAGPIPSVHGVVRWRICDLIQWAYEAFGLSISKQTMSRELRLLGFRKLSARPRHHAQAAEAIPDFKKTSQRSWRRSRRATHPASP